MFKGFTPQTIDFFKGLAADNSRAYMDAHREQFRTHVQEPMKALVEEVGPALQMYDSLIEIRPARCVSRIWTDARYNKGKPPLRDYLWLKFLPAGAASVDHFAFFFEINAGGWSVGAGWYAPKVQKMDLFRRAVLDHPDDFLEAAGDLDNAGLLLHGQDYKRSLAPDQPEALRRWIDKRTWYLTRSEPVGPLMFSPELSGTVEDSFIRLMPLYLFLRDHGIT